MNTPKQTAPKLPAHLAALAKKIDERNAKAGFTDFSKIDRSKLNDFHPLHAMVRGAA